MSTAELEAARLLLQRLGVDPADLLPAGDSRSGGGRSSSGARAGRGGPAPMPTISEYLPRVASAVSPGTRQAYQSYWRRIEQAWGERQLDEPTTIEIQQLAERTRAGAAVRRNSRGGQTAAGHLISAARCLYQHAEDDGLISPAQNPATKARKPRQLASTRRAIPDARLAEINHFAATTGNDPQLDTLLLRLHLETACRRGGALALRPCDLDHTQCLIYLREKGYSDRWQPVSPTLMHGMITHATERGGNEIASDAADRATADHSVAGGGGLLRYRSGRPISSRRYDYLWRRLGEHLPWVRTQGVSAHWLRHTTLTWVERNVSYAVARAYAGHDTGIHAPGLHGTGATATYVRADIEEVAAALAALTGEPHPLAATQNSHNSFAAISSPPAWW